MTKVLFLASALFLAAGCSTQEFAENCFAKASAGGEGSGIPGSETDPATAKGAGGSSAESGCSKSPVD
jgi:hypothetical protein